MDTLYYYFKKTWVEFSIVGYALIGILSLFMNHLFQPISHLVLLLIGISTLFVAASLDRIKVILFLGQNKKLVLKAQLLLYFFSILIIVLMITKLDLLHSLSRWD
ncbi:MAG: hypothetical protein QME58_08200 [Bacteroidota bacterium]|nr:hypothetical protein [Bacteroidota bacterium]